jgi:predicted RNase H-like nuclease (RuvC/YqgF family)
MGMMDTIELLVMSLEGQIDELRAITEEMGGEIDELRAEVKRLKKKQKKTNQPLGKSGAIPSDFVNEVLDLNTKREDWHFYE